MSPRELYREIEAANGRRRDAYELAWQTAKLMSQALAGKLPNLSDVLKMESTPPAPVAKGRTGQLQSKTETAAQVRMLADYYGIPVRKTAH